MLPALIRNTYFMYHQDDSDWKVLTIEDTYQLQRFYKGRREVGEWCLLKWDQNT